jgi:hypothetical protein
MRRLLLVALHLSLLVWVWWLPQVEGGIYMANGRLYDPTGVVWTFRIGVTLLTVLGMWYAVTKQLRWSVGLLGVIILAQMCYWAFMVSWGE